MLQVHLTWPVKCLFARYLACARVKVDLECLSIFTSGPANQPLDGKHDLPAAWPPAAAVRTKRAFRAAPVVLVRGVRMPASAETGTPTFMSHRLGLYSPSAKSAV